MGSLYRIANSGLNLKSKPSGWGSKSGGFSSGGSQRR